MRFLSTTLFILVLCAFTSANEQLSNYKLPILFEPNHGQVNLSSYLGGTGFDFAKGVAVDKAGNIFVTGQTLSKNFPTTPGAPKRNLTGTADGYVVKITP